MMIRLDFNQIIKDAILMIGLSGSDGVEISVFFAKIQEEHKALKRKVLCQKFWKLLLTQRYYSRVIYIYEPDLVSLKPKQFTLEAIIESNYHLLTVLERVLSEKRLMLCSPEAYQLRVLGCQVRQSNFSEAMLEALRFIGKHREKGVRITELFKHLQSKGLSGESKNSHHITKTLEEEGFVIKKLEKDMKGRTASVENRITHRMFLNKVAQSRRSTEAEKGNSVPNAKMNKFYPFYLAMVDYLQFIKKNLGHDKVVLVDIKNLVMEGHQGVFHHFRTQSLCTYLTKLWKNGHGLIELTKLPTYYASSKYSPVTAEAEEKGTSEKSLSAQCINVCLLHDEPIKPEESAQFEHLKERLIFVQDIRQKAKRLLGQCDVGRVYGEALYDQVLRIIYASGTEGVLVKDISHLTQSCPKNVYRLVRKFVVTKPSPIVWVKETGESQQSHLRCFHHKYLQKKEHSETEGTKLRKPKEATTRLEKHSAYVKDIVSNFKVLSMPNMMAIIRNHEDRADSRKIDKRTVLRIVAAHGYTMKEQPVPNYSGGKVSMVVWDPNLVSPTEEELSKAAAEKKSSSRFAGEERFRPRVTPRKLLKLVKPHNKMSSRNQFARLLDQDHDELEADPEREQEQIVHRIRSEKELKLMLQKSLGTEREMRSVWSSFIQARDISLSETSNEQAAKDFYASIDYGSYMARLRIFHKFIWIQMFGETPLDASQSSLVIRQGSLAFSKKGVDLNDYAQKMRLSEYLRVFPIKRKRQLNVIDFQKLKKAAAAALTVSGFIKQYPSFYMFLTPASTLESFMKTFGSMLLVLMVKQTKQGGSVEFMDVNQFTGRADQAPDAYSKSSQVDDSSRTKEQGHYINLDDPRIHVQVRNSIQRTTNELKFVFACQGKLPKTFHCTGDITFSTKTVKFRTVSDIDRFYDKLREGVIDATRAGDDRHAKLSYNVLAKDSFLHPGRWNIEVKRSNKRKRGSFLLTGLQKKQLGLDDKVSASLEQIYQGAVADPKEKPQKKTDSEYVAWFFQNGCVLDKFIHAFGRRAVSRLEKGYRRFGKKRVEVLEQFHDSDDLSSTYFTNLWAYERAFLVLASGSDQPKDPQATKKVFFGFKDGDLRLAVLRLKQEKKSDTLSVFTNSPTICLRNGCLKPKFYEALEEMTSKYLSESTLLDAQRWAENTGVKLMETGKSCADPALNNHEKGPFLGTLLSTISEKLSISLRYLDPDGSYIVDESTVPLVDDDSDEEDPSDQDDDASAAPKEAPILSTKSLKTYEPKFDFFVAPVAPLNCESTRPSIPLKLKTKPKPKTKPSLHKQAEIISQVREKGAHGVKVEKFAMYNLLALEKSHALVKVPCYDHHRYVTLEYITPWVLITKGLKPFTSAVKVAKLGAKANGETEEVNSDNDSSDSDDSYSRRAEQPDDIESLGDAADSKKEPMSGLQRMVQRGEVAFVIARRWTTVTGDTEGAYQRKLCKALAICILLHPGIALSKLHLRFQRFLSPIDVSDLLTVLEDEFQLIRTKTFGCGAGLAYFPGQNEARETSGRKQTGVQGYVPDLSSSATWSRLFE